MPVELLAVVQRHHRVGEGCLARERTATLRKWLSWAQELGDQEEALKANLPSFRKEVLSSKRLLLFKRLLEEISHGDTDLVDHMVSGFDLTGKLPRSNVFLQKFRPAEQSEAQLRKGAKRLRDGLLATIKSCGDPDVDMRVLQATKKEIAKGFVEGPLDLSRVPEHASLTHRFGVNQGQNEEGPKVRPIDNYLSSQVNASVTQVEQVPVHTIDIIAAMLSVWLNEWFCTGRKDHSAPRCKAWDLRAAYKQLPLSDMSYELDSFFVMFNAESGGPEIFRQRVLPFGSKASVSGFIRCAFALWRVGVLSLDLAWSVYFDDYLNVCGQEFVRRNEFVITMFFRLLGWETSADKSLDYDAMCVVLGVQLNLRDAKLGLVFLCNTEKRKMEVFSDIDKALTQGFLDPSTSERLRGRLQFASCQIFGRRPKAALKLLAKHSLQKRWEINDFTRHALSQLRHFLECGRPRPIRARRSTIVHIYVDAAFEPNGLSGIGGVVFGVGCFPLAWFGMEVSARHLERLKVDGPLVRESVIFELEALALAISLEVFKPFVERRSLVAFTDNEGVFGTFVRGHSDNARCSALIEFFGQSEEDLESPCWIDRVPSSSNPADAPSRGQAVPKAPRIQINPAILARALPDVFA